jgi:hypothetical protein
MKVNYFYLRILLYDVRIKHVFYTDQVYLFPLFKSNQPIIF